MVYSGCNSLLIYSALPPHHIPPFLIFLSFFFFSPLAYSGDLCTLFLIRKPLFGGGNAWGRGREESERLQGKAQRSGRGRPGRAGVPGPWLPGPAGWSRLARPPSPPRRRAAGGRERGKEGGMDGGERRPGCEPRCRGAGSRSRVRSAGAARRARNGHDGHSPEAGQSLKRGCLRAHDSHLASTFDKGSAPPIPRRLQALLHRDMP